jgi:hypothetical protein
LYCWSDIAARLDKYDFYTTERKWNELEKISAPQGVSEITERIAQYTKFIEQAKVTDFNNQAHARIAAFKDLIQQLHIAELGHKWESAKNLPAPKNIPEAESQIQQLQNLLKQSQPTKFAPEISLHIVQLEQNIKDFQAVAEAQKKQELEEAKKRHLAQLAQQWDSFKKIPDPQNIPEAEVQIQQLRNFRTLDLGQASTKRFHIENNNVTIRLYSVERCLGVHLSRKKRCDTFLAIFGEGRYMPWHDDNHPICQPM